MTENNGREAAAALLDASAHQANKDLKELLRKDNKEMPARQRIKYFLLRAAVFAMGKIASIAPEKLTYGVCVKLALIAEKRLPRFRKLAREHLEIAFGAEKSPEEIDDILHRTYINYGMNLAEFFMIPHKSKEWIEKKVNFHDPDWIIRTHHQQGKGIVSLAGHFGSWELVGARLGIYHYPIVAVVRAQKDALFSKFMMETRNKWGNEYIFRERGVKEECFRQLDQNKILGLMADQNSNRGVFVNFFGREACTATGPSEIAMTRGIPVIPGFPARNPDGTITLYIQEPIQMRNTGDWQADLAYNTQRCNDALESFAREHPTEYFWWHRRWKKQRDRK